MPELPEVETVVRVLRGQLCGRRVSDARALHPDVFSGRPLRGLRRRTIEALGRRAKLAWMRFDDGQLLTVHLRMTGHLWVAPTRESKPPHTHFELRFDDGESLRFRDPRRFGRLRLIRVEDLDREPFVSSLGPEAAELSLEQLAVALARRRAPLKSALLDQRLVAGLGNIYADEILHRAGLHPLLAACCVKATERERLHEAIGSVIDSAIESGGSSIRDYRDPNQQYGNYQHQHAVFGRGGEACGRCGDTVRKIKVGGRGTHFCPSCQPRRRRVIPRTRPGKSA